MTLRISTTQIEQFRLVMETEWASEVELCNQIKGEAFTPSWQMEAGTAWHSALEGNKWDKIDSDFVHIGIHRWSNYWFADKDVVEQRAFIGDGIWEVKATKEIEGCTIVAKADHLHGLVIQDNKTRWGKPDDARDREASLQWRLYLLVHEAVLFRYNVFEFATPDGGGYCELRNTVSYSFWPYAGMERDCRDWIKRFVDWADSNGLLPYLDRGLEAA